MDIPKMTEQFNEWVNFANKMKNENVGLTFDQALKITSIMQTQNQNACLLNIAEKLQKLRVVH